MSLVYPKFLESLWKGEIDATSDTFRAILVDSSYIVSSAHQFYSDLTGILGEVDMTAIDFTDGIFDAADALIVSPSAGEPIAVVVCKWTGSGATSPLFLYIDQGLGFGQDPDGNALIIWSNNTTTKIFPLGGVA